MKNKSKLTFSIKKSLVVATVGAATLTLVSAGACQQVEVNPIPEMEEEPEAEAEDTGVEVDVQGDASTSEVGADASDSVHDEDVEDTNVD